MSCTPSVVVNTPLKIGVEKVLVCLSAANDGYVSAADISFDKTGVVYTINRAAGSFIDDGFVLDDQIVVATTDGTNDGTYTISAAVEALKLTVKEPVVTDEAQASCVIYSEEVFKITPTRRMGQTCIMVYNTAVATPGDMTFSVAPGAFWAAGVALTGIIADEGYTLLFVETALYLQADGTILLTLAPAAGKQLTTDHTAEVCFVELP